MSRPAPPPGDRESGTLPYNRVWRFTLEDAGFAPQPPARTYAVTVSPDIRADDGQTLGYTWLGIIENWHQRAFTSFGDGHGVWESGGGTTLPFYARNLTGVTEWLEPIKTGDLMGRLIELQQQTFRIGPAGPGRDRRLGDSWATG